MNARFLSSFLECVYKKKNKSFDFKKSEKGITLVEVVVSVAILAIIMLPISLAFTTAYSSFINEADKITAQQSAREVLYGKGLGSYGIMGDLERSNAAGEEITIGDFIDESGTKGRTISIKYPDATIRQYKFIQDAVNGDKLFYRTVAPDNSILSEQNYFENDYSSNGNKVVVKSFSAEKISKGADIDPDPGKTTVTDTDIIKLQVSVCCGKSGDITLESSYRIPDIEK